MIFFDFFFRKKTSKSLSLAGEKLIKRWSHFSNFDHERQSERKTVQGIQELFCLHKFS